MLVRFLLPTVLTTIVLLSTAWAGENAPVPALSELDAPLNIWDVTGFERRGDICSTGVPLPYGTLREATGIAVYAPSGKTVPAQFRVLERWREFGQDGRSVKWLLVTFLADVPAGGRATYRLKAGKNPVPSLPTGVEKIGGGWRMGGLEFKEDFSAPFRAILTTPEGKEISAGELPLKWSVWEKGPVRACLKVESPTVPGKFGFIAWIYAYAGRKRWDMDVVLENTPNKMQGPLYFRDFSVVWEPPELKGARNYQLGGEWGKTIKGTLKTDAVYLYQASDGSKDWDKLRDRSRLWAGGFVSAISKTIKQGVPQFRGYKAFSGGKELAGGNLAQGWAALSSGKSAAFVCVRNFRRNYPKAVEVAPGKIAVRLWPKYWKGHGGLHWLDDCSRKRHHLSFALASAAGNGETRARKFDAPLVAHCGVDWYRRTGVIGYISKRWKDQKPVVTKEQEIHHDNWVTIGGSTMDRNRRRYHGGSGNGFIKTGLPEQSYSLEVNADHAAGMTPFWVDDYEYPGSKGAIKVPAGYLAPPRATGSYRPGTAHHAFKAWNNAHFMCDELFDAWRLLGDPLALEATRKVGVYMQLYADHRQSRGTNQARNDSMPFHNLCHAYRITGDESMLKSLYKLRNAAWKQVNKGRGYYAISTWNYKGKLGVQKVEAVWQLSCLANGLREFYHLTRDEVAADLMLGILNYQLEECYVGNGSFDYKAMLDWNLQKERARKPKYGPEVLRDSTKNRSFRSRGICPALAWAYLYTGEERYKGMFDVCLLYTSPSPRDGLLSRMPSSA